jgi:hypothetical protein
LPAWCWYWLGCYSFWFRYWFRPLLELVVITMQWPELPTHGASNICVSTIFWKLLLGRTDKLGRGVLVLVALLQPLVPVSVNIFTLELKKLPCNGQNFPLIVQVTYTFRPFFTCTYWEEKINLPAWCCSGLGCYSLWFPYLSTSLH